LHSLSRTTVRHIANLLHLALKDAVKRGLIARNPVDQTEPPSRETKTPTILTPEQLRIFLEDARANAPIYLYALYVTKSMTGMPFGELLGARETDLDLEHGVVIVEQTLKRPGPQAAFGKPKTPRSRRAVTLPVEVVDALRQLRRWKIEQKLRLGPKFRDYGLVFCLPSGRPMHPNNIRRRDLYPRLERLGLPRIRPHDLRHTHGTQLIAAGVDHRTVADRLGHSSPAFTMSVYVHGVSESQRRAAETATTLLLPSRGSAR
jgi:integrase